MRLLKHNITVNIAAIALMAFFTGCEANSVRNAAKVVAPEMVDAEDETGVDHKQLSEDIQAVLFSQQSEGAKVIDAVALSVNGEIITASEIFYPISPSLRQLAKESATRDDFISKCAPILQDEVYRQIGQVLVEQNAEEKLSEAELAYMDNQVEEHIKKLSLMAGGSMNKLASDLSARGTSIEAVKTASRRELLSHYYVRQKMAPKLNFTRREVLKYYRTHSDEFSSEALVKMQVMYFPYENFTSPEEAQKSAKEIYDRVIAGEDFTKIIRSESATKRFRASTGGVWDFLPAGSFRETVVEQTAFNQNVDTLSKPINGQSGVFLVKTIDLQPAREVTFEDAQQTIHEKLTEQRNSRLAMELYVRLQQEAKIRRNADFQQYALKLAADIYFNAHEE